MCSLDDAYYELLRVVPGNQNKFIAAQWSRTMH